MRSFVLCLLPLSAFSFVILAPWGTRTSNSISARPPIVRLKEGSSNLDDWRDFRTKLIQKNSNSSGDALDAGYLIEAGSIVLSEVESTLGCHDLNQPYLHKAVVLLLEHSETEFTKGVLLNRPTDLILSDDEIIYLDDDGEPIQNEGSADKESNNQWKMHFGGDLAGLYDENPLIVCLHSLTSSDMAKNLSDTVMPGIYYTSHASARLLIAWGEAKTSDFFVTYGFCGWDPGQLFRELKRGSWSMVSTMSADIILRELQHQQNEQKPLIDPRTAGLQMWESFRSKVGKDAHIGRGSFSDLMLTEWATDMLCIAQEDDNVYDDSYEEERVWPELEAGMLVRGSSRNPSPFLLHEQLFHKAIVLVLSDSDDATVGLILNLPTTEAFVLETPNGKSVEFTIRYGGISGEEGEEPLLWFHNSRGLRKLGIGTPVNDSKIWTCTIEDVAKAIDQGTALPAEFLLVQGFSVWEKEDGETGMAGMVALGNFEVVSSSQIENSWSLLQSQKRLEEGTLDWNIHSTLNAWLIAGLFQKGGQKRDNESARLVFDSNVTVADLADDAMRNWVDIFLLGDTEYAIP